MILKGKLKFEILPLPPAPLDMGDLTIRRGHTENNERYFFPRAHLKGSVKYFDIRFVFGPGVCSDFKKFSFNFWGLFCDSSNRPNPKPNRDRQPR